MEATPDVYRADIAHTIKHIALIDAGELLGDTVEQAQERRALLVRQLAGLQRSLEQAAAAYVACPQCGSPMRKTRRGGGPQRQEAWICTRAEAERYTDERGHTKTTPDAVHAFVRVWTRDELELPS